MGENARTLAGSIYSCWAQGMFLYGKWAAGRGVNYYEMLVFYALDAKGSLTQKAIGDYCGLPKQTVHNVICSLQRQGHILLLAGERDRREKRVVLTESGQARSRGLLAPLYRLEEQVCKNIGQERLGQMIETSELFNLLFERGLEKDHDGA